MSSHLTGTLFRKNGDDESIEYGEVETSDRETGKVVTTNGQVYYVTKSVPAFLF
jgi:hypothetical protein